MNSVTAVLKMCLFGFTSILLIGGLAYTESTFSSTARPPESPAGSPSLQLTPPKQLWALASGVKLGIRMGASYAVKSDAHEGFWYVAAEMYHVPRGNLEIATWIMTGTKSNPGLVISVDSAAQALSIWPSPQDRVSASEDDVEVQALVTALKER